MSLLTSDEARRITAAVTQVEKNTGGEIVTAIIPESDDYASRELLFGIIAGVLTFLVAVLFFSPSINALLSLWFWNESAILSPLAMMVLALGVGTLAYLAAQIPAIDRIIVGRHIMAEAVRRRALRHFTESAAYDTIDKTGILLFISVLERRVELIADRGINALVLPDTWDRIVSSLVRGIKEKRIADAIETAIKEIGEVLAEHVPQRPEDENEIADKPTELGKGT